MKQTILIVICIVGFISNIQSQEIRGQLIRKSQNKIDTLPGVSVMIDTAYVISDIDGFFTFNKLKSYPDSILFSGYMYPKLLITNLPKDYESMDFGQVELIEHLLISPTQYDSIRTNLIKSFKTNEVLIIQQQKADSELRSKYCPIKDWSNTVGYVVLDSITKDTMQNPLDKRIMIKVDYDVFNDRITLDYNKINK